MGTSMTLSNDMTRLLNKIERRLGLTPLIPSLPEYLNKESWAKTIMEDSIVTFSRYFPYHMKMVINDESCDKKKEDNIVWYYIKSELLEGIKLLGVLDIDWLDNTSRNASLGATSLGGGFYYPSFACPAATFESIISLQTNADFASLYNRGVYIDFEYPNRFAIKGLGNTNYDLNSFVLILLIEHKSLSTISPTKMETFESLAIADVAKFLYMNLRYYDNLNTAFVEIDLKLQELQSESEKRDAIIEELKNSYVSTSNSQIPYIFTI